MNPVIAWLLGLVPDAIKALAPKPGEKLEEPLGQSEADKAKQQLDDQRAARKANRH
jgi:hypothetical protein